MKTTKTIPLLQKKFICGQDFKKIKDRPGQHLPSGELIMMKSSQQKGELLLFPINNERCLFQKPL